MIHDHFLTPIPPQAWERSDVNGNTVQTPSARYDGCPSPIRWRAWIVRDPRFEQHRMVGALEGALCYGLLCGDHDDCSPRL